MTGIKTRHIFLAGFLLLSAGTGRAQPLLATGPDMPDTWIDKDTRHRVVRLSRDNRSNLSFYFHNNPFAGDQMVYYSTAPARPTAAKQETYNSSARDRQLYRLDLKTYRAVRLTDRQLPMQGEILSVPRGEAFFQIRDSVFAVNLRSRQQRLIYVFPEDFKGTVTTINADGSLLAGVRATDQEKELFKQHPDKSNYFNLIYEARLPRTLFTLSVDKGTLEKIHRDSAWLNHVQFSPTDPKLLMFCHEGPWHKVDRIWTIDIRTRKIHLIHKRTMPMEIAGHEWFSQDGSTIFFDLQQPRGQRFFVAGVDLKTGRETRYELDRNNWSVHYISSADNRFFAGDGGDRSSVARAPDGKWIYLLRPRAGRMVAEKLVNMQHHAYRLEPNVHISPDQQWVIFRANFEGRENIYAVRIAAEP
ncbi:oligogalacturonate lyase family protein [Niabella terrae]